MQQLLDTENDAASLYNLFASTQNTPRQMIRERLYQPSQRRYSEEFINSRRLDAQTTGEHRLQRRRGHGAPTEGDRDRPGLGEDGRGERSDPPPFGYQPAAGRPPGDGLRLDRPPVELVFTFNSPQIINRVSHLTARAPGALGGRVHLYPDGVLKEDLLADLPAANLSIDGSAGKYSGDWIADFDPRSVQQLRIVLADFVGNPSITIRNVTFLQRTFSNSGIAQSLRIDAPQGTVVFRADQHYADKLTSISHQISTDGVHYTAIVPDQQIDVGSGGFWYRAGMSAWMRTSTKPPARWTCPARIPASIRTTSVSNITTVDLGNGILERTINLASVSGMITLKETPLGGTLVVYQGTVVLPPPGYAVSGNDDHLSPAAHGDHAVLPDLRLCQCGVGRPEELFHPLSLQRFVRASVKHRY